MTVSFRWDSRQGLLVTLDHGLAMGALEEILDPRLVDGLGWPLLFLFPGWLSTAPCVPMNFGHLWESSRESGAGFSILPWCLNLSLLARG